MSIFNKFLIGLILSILCIGTINAAPMYYTFQGTATTVTDIDGSSGIAVNDVLEYVFLIDFELGGEATNLDGSISSIVDVFSSYEPSVTYNEATMDNFYVDYSTGNAYFGLEGVNNDFLELNAGVDNYDLGRFIITGGDAIGIASFTDPVSSWMIGDTFFSLNAWGDQSERINGSVSLVNISPVPLPASLTLFCFGLAGLSFASKKKSQGLSN